MREAVQPSRLNEILEDLVALRRATRDADVPVVKPDAEEDVEKDVEKDVDENVAA